MCRKYCHLRDLPDKLDNYDEIVRDNKRLYKSETPLLRKLFLNHLRLRQYKLGVKETAEYRKQEKYTQGLEVLVDHLKHANQQARREIENFNKMHEDILGELKSNYSKVLEKTLESCDEPKIVIDNEGIIIAVSEVFKKDFYFQDDIIGKKCYDILKDYKNGEKYIKEFFNSPNEKKERMILIRGDKKGVKVDVLKYKKTQILNSNLPDVTYANLVPLGWLPRWFSRT